MSTSRRILARYPWELLLVVMLIGAVIINTYISPFYLNLKQILRGLEYVMVPGIVALGLMVVVIQGEIDISLPSQVAVGTVMLGMLANNGVPYAVAAPVVLIVGCLMGLLNGVIVTSFGLPSMAVTFGTLAAYRGLAFLLPGGEVGYASTVFNDQYLWLGDTSIAKLLPVGLVIFAIAAGIFGVLVHRTTYGRRTYAIGNNISASRFSGVRVNRIKVQAYVLAGFMAAIGALIFVGQYQSARGDNFDGQLLFIVAAIVLGGIDLNGGRGRVIGLVLSILLLGTLYNGMGLANVDAPLQVVVFGVLLIGSVLVPRIVGMVRSRYVALRRAAIATAA
jgi:rhamnose transport system permease protein